LLDWGFDHHDRLRPVGTLVKPAEKDRSRTSAGTGPTVSKKSTGTPLPKRSKTVLAPGHAVQAVMLRLPVWTYAAPAFLLLRLFLRRPKALRRARGRRRSSPARRAARG
jgi:D-alanyl-D-alanine carboxypeptidase (penicillin-binding protein 5/6)